MFDPYEIANKWPFRSDEAKHFAVALRVLNEWFEKRAGVEISFPIGGEKWFLTTTDDSPIDETGKSYVTFPTFEEALRAALERVDGA